MQEVENTTNVAAINGNNMLAVVLSLWSKIPSETKVWVQFCFDCGEVTAYSEEDTCSDCYTRYKPDEDGEDCPNCGSDKYYSHCEKCDEELDACYLDDLLSDKHREWSEIELETIKIWCENQLSDSNR